ncbi:Chitin bind 3 domain containing protein, partial [Asbolus verrucosus]
VQWGPNKGKCGVCGDNWASPVPRTNENTGTFGNGIVTKTYKSGSVIDISVTLTANHMGTFTYSLCVLQDPSKPESEDCFTDLKLADGSSVYNVDANDYDISNKVQLPAGVTCERCVLRWHYKTGNSWGVCDDGTEKMGCGAQETFRSCSDISIV